MENREPKKVLIPIKMEATMHKIADGFNRAVLFKKSP